MSQQLPPPWALGSKEINGVPMYVVYMQNGELEGLDNLQGGPSVDEQTGIREYSKLADIIEIPEIRELFHNVANQIEGRGDLSPDLHEAYESSKDNSLPYRETEEEEHNPLRELEKKGRNGDSKLAYIPENLAEFLVELRHNFSINPEVGIPEFWTFKNFLKSIIRVGGTIGGALLGGPLGAGAGRALAGIATGQKLGHAAMSGLQGGALAYGAQGLGQAAGLTGATPYSGGFFGGAPNALASGLGGMGIGHAGQAAAASAQGLPAAQQVINSAFSQPQTPGLLGALANVGSSLAPYAPLAMAGLSYMGEKQHHKHEQKEKDRLESKWDKEREDSGLYNWTPVTSKKREANPDFWDLTADDIKHGRIHAPYTRESEMARRYARGGLVQSYNKGTLVRGKGKGQDDLIKTNVPDGTYISDASTNSMLGDGSSEAGAKVWTDFEIKVKRKVPKSILKHVEKSVRKKSQQVPVWLSDSEYKLDPVTVSLLPYALGERKISNERGADILRSTIKNIRKHKSQAGSGLPPKAKPLMEYISASR